MRTVAIIQARTGSTRFPRKIFAPLWGSTVLHHVVARTSQIAGVDAVAIACPASDRDAIAAHIRPAFPEVYVVAAADVPDEDVLGRYWVVARHLEADVVVRITADCPALNVALAGELIEMSSRDGYAGHLLSTASGYTTWPDGWDVEVIPRALLDRAHTEAVDEADREHVTPWMYRRRHITRQPGLGDDVPPRGVKLSVDTPEDLARLEALGPPS